MKHPLHHIHARSRRRFVTGLATVFVAGVVGHSIWKHLYDLLKPKRPPYGGAGGGSETPDG